MTTKINYGPDLEQIASFSNTTKLLPTQQSYVEYDIFVTDETPQSQTKSATPTESAQTITPDSGYLLSSVNVGAISSSYVGSGITQRSSTDLSASGNTVSVPSGYYASSASKAVASGTEGTPTATKSSVSNHSVSVTPSVTNVAGYIAGGTHSGTAVSVSASELVSGTYTVDSSGTKDVTNYASASIAAGSATASATKGSVSNHAISVTPSVTRTAGWVTAGSASGTAVSVSASELVSGTYTVDSSGTKDVTNYASASVPAMTLPNSAISSSSGTKKTTIGPTVNTRYLNIPSGFNDTAQYYELSPVILGTKTITTNGLYDAEAEDLHGYSFVTVNVSGGGGSDVAVDVVEGASTSTSITFSNLKGEPTSFSLMADGQISTGTPAKVAAVVYDGTDLHVQTITSTSNAQVTYVSSGFTKSYSNGTLTISNSSASFAGNYYLVYTYDGGAGNISTADVQVDSGATSITFTGLEDEPLCWSCIFKSNFSTSSGYQRVIFARYDGDITEGMEMDSSAHAQQHWSASYNNGSLTITSNGTNQGGYFHQPGSYQLTYAFAGGGGNYQSKTVTPTTSQQVVQADSGYDALKKVTVEAMPSMTLPTAASGTSSGTSKATITPTSSAQYLNIPTGYNGTASYYTIAAASGGSVTVKTTTMTNNSATATQIQFTQLSEQPKAFFCRCTSNLSRSSSNRYYYIADLRWDGSSTGGVAGNKYYVYNGQYSNQTTGYSQSYSSGTLTLTTTGSQTASPGSFFNGTYELVYVY